MQCYNFYGEYNMNDKKEFQISRIVLSIIVFIVMNIAIINEDKSWLVIPAIFAVISYVFCFISTGISRKIIEIGNKIPNILLKVSYYVLLPIIILIICIGLLWIMELLPSSVSLGNALLLLFVIVVLCVCVILPYVQSLVVLFIRKFVIKR